MCGRYRLSRRKELIAEYFDMVDEIDWEPRYNIAPTQNVGIIRQNRTQPVRKFALVRRGLIPYWAKDPSIGQKMINARSETILDKPAFSRHSKTVVAWYRRTASTSGNEPAGRNSRFISG